MSYKKIVKVPGGKLVSVKIEARQEKIHRITISGDFFLHPEETIFTIEKQLQGTSLNATKEDLTHIISSAAEKSKFIGINPGHIAMAILEAVNK